MKSASAAGPLRARAQEMHGLRHHGSGGMEDAPEALEDSEEELRENAAVVGEGLLRGLEYLRDRHGPVGDARGRGLFSGIEFVHEGEDVEPAAELADAAVQRMRDHGILLSTDGPDRNVIKMKPPLVFSEADADLLVSNLDEVLSETAFPR